MNTLSNHNAEIWNQKTYTNTLEKLQSKAWLVQTALIYKKNLHSRSAGSWICLWMMNWKGIEWRVEVSELVCGIGSFCYSWLNISSQLTLLKVQIIIFLSFTFLQFKLDWSVIFGFAGSLLSALFIQLGISIGASGALFGLLRGMLLELITNWTIYANKMYVVA